MMVTMYLHYIKALKIFYLTFLEIVYLSSRWLELKMVPTRRCWYYAHIFNLRDKKNISVIVSMHGFKDFISFKSWPAEPYTVLFIDLFSYNLILFARGSIMIFQKLDLKSFFLEKGLVVT